MIPQSPRPPSGRIPWLLMGGAALVLLFGCALIFVASLFLRSNWSAAQSSSAMQRAALPTPTPRPQVIVQPPPDGVDYESAVLMQLYSQVNPSVVNVAIYQLGANIHSDDIAGLSADAYYEAGSGSGFVWDSEGHIVTNNHVVEGAERIVVRFSDGTMSAGEVIGADRHSDLAVIHIDPEGYNLVPVRQGNLDEVQVGQRVAAIGNPFGLDGTLTSGIVSAIGRSIPSSASFSIPASIQTDAPINPGNSGGPLLNERGEVIGVNAQIRSEERANSGVGFAIPISIVQRVVPSLIQDGRYRHPYIGISGSSFSPICADEQRLDPRLRGAMVLEVLPGTPAAKAGLMDGEQGVNTLYPEICPRFRGGDVITAVNGSLVGSFDEVLSFLQRFTSPGDTVDFTVLRNGDSLQIPVTLTERPQSR